MVCGTRLQHTCGTISHQQALAMSLVVVECTHTPHDNAVRGGGQSHQDAASKQGQQAQAGGIVHGRVSGSGSLLYSAIKPGARMHTHVCTLKSAKSVATCMNKESACS
eukprot:GHUV01049108.1.p1 GENE.GHUV01049108.1~~GHUV01049108.1.p1  ORF type:complete len:108 (+),score=16.95 GHUV01049108.1:13-336(+)